MTNNENVYVPITIVETITEELVEDVKQSHYSKLGYINIINSMGADKATPELLCKCGEACHTHQQIGDKIAMSVAERNNIKDPVTSWECNFDNNTFTITVQPK